MFEDRGKRMKQDELARLERLNQICLTSAECDRVRAFFAAREREAEAMAAVDTEGVAPTVHVMPTSASLREDEVHAPFSRTQMQRDAIKTDAGYFCVPRVLD